MLKIFGTKKFFGTRFVASFTRRLVFSPNNEANKFIYLFIIASKKDIKKETNSLFSHFSLFSTSSSVFFYVHSIPSFYFTPFIRQSIVDDDDDGVATLPSLFRNSWTSTFIRWSKFPACILLWLKFADFYAVLKCILMLHVGRMARGTRRSSKKISKKVSLSLSLFSKEYIYSIFYKFLFSFRCRTYD